MDFMFANDSGNFIPTIHFTGNLGLPAHLALRKANRLSASFLFRICQWTERAAGSERPASPLGGPRPERRDRRVVQPNRDPANVPKPRR